MKTQELELYRCPETLECLQLKAASSSGDEIESGTLVCPSGKEYAIRDGIANLTYPQDLAASDANARVFYDERVDAYDNNLHLTFKTHKEEEEVVRNNFVDALELKPSSRVLEISCGTGRDSEVIAGRLDSSGLLCLQDIASGMLRRCREKLSGFEVRKSFGVSNACYLPYPDKFFDAVYSFGGLGEFSDIKRSLAEMARVSKVGAKVVVGDESIPPWLRGTEFANILATTNKQFLAEVPLREIPLEARQVCLRWVIGGVFYLIDFKVGVGAPEADFDFEIPGPRGGTYRTRYTGQLEGVSAETKHLAQRAREKSGVSMYRWLDQVIRKAAEGELQSDIPPK